MVALACLPLVLIISSCLPSLTTSQAVVAMGSFSAEFSLSLTYKGQKLDFSVLLSVIQGKLDQSLFSLIPPALQPLVPPELAAALKNETVLELKAELQAVLQVLKTVADPKELLEQLKKVMPKTVEVGQPKAFPSIFVPILGAQAIGQGDKGFGTEVLVFPQ